MSIAQSHFIGFGVKTIFKSMILLWDFVSPYPSFCSGNRSVLRILATAGELEGQERQSKGEGESLLPQNSRTGSAAEGTALLPGG